MLESVNVKGAAREPLAPHPLLIDVDPHARALEDGDLNLKHLASQVSYRPTA